MGRGKKKPLLSVAQVFTKCQEGVSGHNKYAKILWDVQEAEPDNCWKEFCFCLEHLLALPESNTHVERAVRFVATFTSQRPSGRQEAGDAFVEDILTHLISLAEAEDKGVRLRVCQLLQLIINNQAGPTFHLHLFRKETQSTQIVLTLLGMPQLSCLADEEAALSEDLADSLLATMLARLRDKQPAIRCQAALALARLADPGKAGDFADDAVTGSYLKLLSIEKNKDVRKAVLHSLSAARCSLPEILNRTRDISDEVRKMAYAAIRDRVPLEFLSLEQRACLIRRGLGERKAAVRDCAVALMCHWLNVDASGSVPSLLRLLDVHKAEEEAEQVLLALIACGRLQPAALSEEATEGDAGLRRAPGSGCMSDELALMWRVICTWLQDEGSAKGRAAAAASGAVADVEAARASDALEALEATLPAAAEHLMALVAEHAAAGAGSGFAARQLLAIAACCVDLSDAAARKAASELVQSILGDREAAPAQDRAMAAAVMRLAGQVAGSPSELAALTLDAIADCLHLQEASLNAAGPEEGADDEGCWLHCLNLASVLLEDTPLKMQRPVATNNVLTCLADISRHLVMPGMEMGSAVRAEAVRCAGLLCMLGDSFQADASGFAQRIALLRTALLTDLRPRVCEAAARALCDLAVLRGPRALDQRYMPLLDHPSDTDQNPAAIEEASLPVLDVLLGRLTAVGGGMTRADNDDYAVVTAVAEGLAKLLLHQQLPGSQTAPLEDAETHKVLAQLLVLACDPGLAAAARMQQCLTVFFHAYAPLSAAAQERLCAAALPAGRRALAAGPAPARSAAPQLLRYVLSLLQMDIKGEESAEGAVQSSNGHVRLTEAALKEALACPAGQASKPYIAALLKLANGLSLKGASQEDVKRVRALAQRAAENVKDRNAAKDAAALARRLSDMDSMPNEGLSEEALQALLASVEEMTAATEALFESAAPPSPRAGRPARGRGPAKPAGRRRRVAAASSESEDEESSTSSEEAGTGSETESAEPALAASNTAAPVAPSAVHKGKQATKAQLRLTRRMQRENVAPIES
ncbi:hypothetical protein COCSUDRAFT_43416 [Coccomyxa subellipsoidea C-169]|uniref:Nuclear condensin complex subunit 3 C-terminal domain-containing protein n=1 Tax=Coccomyxa subellipsoidea (strain C-169) TaxID=574566 RepID=I0YRP0_COCSC|nr:hypothetical protein COCSUDRAFT_43416 [Coccomyxa subellipsoidea C-169]EIE21059.1 hypothetical protein COCSUDRAFT_43416 [Coccomyxa subellipsoidea C-169]|eukprot:XP_005645603.1 hypothetical protein COCSUDRAFT_43416 [Coccomyxa subellipsoidea C-169]